MAAQSKIIWRFVDGKSGHENQTQGLVEALREYLSIESIDIPHKSFFSAITCLLLKTFPLSKIGKPDLIIGAGHRTHLSMLAAKRTWSAPTIVLMNPSMPRRLFDMCIIPEHDKVKASANVLLTDGVLNQIKPNPARQPGSGLILIGGPSKHVAWSDQHVIEQLQKIDSRSDIYFTVVTSRRTPASFVKALEESKISNLSLVLVDETEPGWLAEQLPQCEQAWISEDSVSMVYEALSAGAACGVIQSTNERSPKLKNSRIMAGLEKLKREKYLITFDEWDKGAPLESPQVLLAEASRCAKIVAEKWLIKN